MSKIRYKLTEAGIKAGVASVTHKGKNYKVMGKDMEKFILADEPIAEHRGHHLEMVSTEEEVGEAAQKALADMEKWREKLQKYLDKDAKKRKTFEDALTAGKPEAEAAKDAGFEG